MIDLQTIKFFFKENIKIILPIAFIIGLIVLIVVLVSTSIKASKNATHNAVYKDRVSNCLSVYNEKYIPIKNLERNQYIYFNQFYNTEMSYSLRDYYWAGSYKSYLPCGNWDDVISYNAIRDNLESGARIINLDLFYSGLYAYSSDAKVVVGNSIEDKIMINGEEKKIRKLNYLEGIEPTYLDYEQCLKIIKENGFKTNQPLILYLNIGFDENKILEYQVFKGLIDILGDKFMDKMYSFSNVNFGAIRMDKALGKLLIICNRLPVNPNLGEITNGIININPLKNFNSINLYQLTQNDIQYGGIKVKLFDKESALKITKYVMTGAYLFNEPNKEKNDYEHKYTSNNFDSQSCFDFGVQMIFMNFQKRDNYFLKFLEEFKEGGIKRKPDELIFIPQPKPTVYERDPKFDFVKMDDSMFGGFENIQI